MSGKIIRILFHTSLGSSLILFAAADGASGSSRVFFNATIVENIKQPARRILIAVKLKKGGLWTARPPFSAFDCPSSGRPKLREKWVTLMSSSLLMDSNSTQKFHVMKATLGQTISKQTLRSLISFRKKNQISSSCKEISSLELFYRSLWCWLSVLSVISAISPVERIGTDANVIIRHVPTISAGE